MTDFLGAAPGQRSPSRLGYRAGYYERGLITRVGKIELRVPRDRNGEFSTSLFERFQRSEKALLSAYRSIATAVDEGRGITPAAEWVLDNYHVVEEQIREVREDLPPGFYRQLPKLAEGPFAGFPRVFGIAWAFVAHTDSRFDPEFLRHFVRAYQEVAPLTIGELWAVAITLRIVLVENLRRLAASATIQAPHRLPTSSARAAPRGRQPRPAPALAPGWTS